jgi:predicted nucleic acid-binding protein
VTCVADASVVVAYLVGQASEAERAVMTGAPHAPSLLDVELTHTLRGLLAGGKLSLGLAERARADLAQLGGRRHPDAALLRRAWELRNMCTVYDGLYVALAEALDAGLLTRDGRLARGVAHLVDLVEPDEP